MIRSLSKFSHLIVPVLAAAIATTAPATAATKIVVKNWSFSPATITAHVGKPTKLAFDTKEGVHGVESADVGIAKTMLMPGKVTSVSFTPTKPGRFAVHCAVVCGAGHAKMMFAVKVVK